MEVGVANSHKAIDILKTEITLAIQETNTSEVTVLNECIQTLQDNDHYSDYSLKRGIEVLEREINNPEPEYDLIDLHRAVHILTTAENLDKDYRKRVNRGF